MNNSAWVVFYIPFVHSGFLVVIIAHAQGHLMQWGVTPESGPDICCINTQAQLETRRLRNFIDNMHWHELADRGYPVEVDECP